MAHGTALIIGMRSDRSSTRPCRGRNKRPGRALRFLLPALICPLVLAACSLRLEISLFNDSGEAITIALWHKDLPIEPGQFGVFDYPGPNENGQVHISAGRCSYIYEVPQGGLPHLRNAGNDGPLNLQVEKDFAIYVLPPDAGSVVSTAELSAFQKDGFPLHPTSKICR